MKRDDAFLLKQLKAGRRLMWWGDNGPQLEGHPCWPSKAMVRRLIAAGVLKWGEPLNATQAECGIVPVVLANESLTEVPSAAERKK